MFLRHLPVLLTTPLAILLITPAAATAQKATFSLSPGYTFDNFRWSIAGNNQGTSPNIYSELKWTNLSGPTLTAEADYNFWKNWHIHSSFSRASITAGHATDTDYHGDDRTDTAYYGAFTANKGSTHSFYITLDDRLHITTRLSLTVLIGYSRHNQSLFLLDPAAGLHSSYATRTDGLAAGLRTEFRLTKTWSLQGSLVYDRFAYHATADWNLILSFRHPLSFEDKANGLDLQSNLRCVYHPTTNWSLFLSATILHSGTGRGTDLLYLQNGQDLSTQFNGASLNSLQASIGATLLLPSRKDRPATHASPRSPTALSPKKSPPTTHTRDRG